MTLRDLIKEIIESKELKTEEKIDIIDKLMHTGSILPNHYLVKKQNEEIECWYRYENKKGQVKRKNTGWDNPKQIINEYLKTNNKTKRR